MNIRSIYARSLFASCLLVGVVGCSGSSSETESIEVASEDSATQAAPSATDETVEISVVIGQTSGSAVAYQATLGSKVQIKLLNPDADDEFHLHGYDLLATATAGQEVMIDFTADQLGSFDLESHKTGEWILTLVVEEP